LNFNHLDENELRLIPLVALFAALGILFPQFFHLLGLGAAFLPMFLPIMVGSMFLTWRFVLLLAVLTPLVSWLLTSMPPLTPPILPILVIEFISIGLLISLLRQHSNLSVISILLIAIFMDRLILFITVSLIAPIFNIEHPLFSVAIVISGIPGIVLQIIVVPLTVYLIEKKYPYWRTNNATKE
jgi:hypothetical protein